MSCCSCNLSTKTPALVTTYLTCSCRDRGNGEPPMGHSQLTFYTSFSLSLSFFAHTHTPKWTQISFHMISLSLSLTHTHTHTRSCTKFSTLTQSFSLSHKSFSACDTRSVARSVLLHLDSCFFFLHVLFWTVFVETKFQKDFQTYYFESKIFRLLWIGSVQFRSVQKLSKWIQIFSRPMTSTRRTLGKLKICQFSAN